MRIASCELHRTPYTKFTDPQGENTAVASLAGPRYAVGIFFRPVAGVQGDWKTHFMAEKPHLPRYRYKRLRLAGQCNIVMGRRNRRLFCVIWFSAS
jgi:hypothetical protein